MDPQIWLSAPGGRGPSANPLANDVRNALRGMSTEALQQLVLNEMQRTKQKEIEAQLLQENVRRFMANKPNVDPNILTQLQHVLATRDHAPVPNYNLPPQETHVGHL